MFSPRSGNCGDGRPVAKNQPFPLRSSALPWSARRSVLASPSYHPEFGPLSHLQLQSNRSRPLCQSPATGANQTFLSLFYARPPSTMRPGHPASRAFLVFFFSSSSPSIPHGYPLYFLFSSIGGASPACGAFVNEPHTLAYRASFPFNFFSPQNRMPLISNSKAVEPAGSSPGEARILRRKPG